MHQKIKFPKFVFAESVFEEIRDSIGSLPAETGGVLGGNPATGEVTRFFFDKQAVRSAITYSVDANRINPVLAAWNADETNLVGMIHSHPPGSLEPSIPDVEFAARLLNRKDNNSLPYFLIPIVQSSARGAFSMRLFAVTRGLTNCVIELPYEVRPLREAGRFPIQCPNYRKMFSRVRDSYDLPRLHQSMAIMVGCGGAASFIEDLARTGLRFFVLFDPDIVSAENIATQQTYLKDVGRPKVAVIEERIRQINPHAVVSAIQEPLDLFKDDAFRTLIFEEANAGEEIEARILCGLTDSFFAQMRTNLLALKFAIPALAAQVYRGGSAAEIVFTHPETTNQCMRCILSQRYDAYLNRGFQNDATSQGSQYSASIRLNATKFVVAMALLHHGSPQRYWGPMLSRIGQRNCIQIRCDPDVETSLGLHNFSKAFAGASPDRLFCDETVWLPQHPENRANGYSYVCPDCLGTGDLMDSMGRVEETTELIPKNRHGG